MDDDIVIIEDDDDDDGHSESLPPNNNKTPALASLAEGSFVIESDSRSDDKSDSESIPVLTNSYSLKDPACYSEYFIEYLPLSPETNQSNNVDPLAVGKDRALSYHTHN